jgi:leader peptidase (prepilin peptidase)/N-methyltransferase
MNESGLLYPWAAYTMLGVFSLAVGSFLNVLIYRLPLMLQSEWRTECRQLLELPEEPAKKINLFYPRSFCPGCKKMISAWQNIPLLSYIFLRGHCAHCKQHIPLRYPLVEFLCMSLSIFAAMHFGFNTTLPFALLFIWLIISMCFIDLQHQLLPDSLSLGLLWLGLMANTQSLFISLPVAVWSAIGAYLSLWLIMKLFWLYSGKVGMGHGDFKLFAALGAWFGWIQLPIILIISSVTGIITGLIYLKCTGKTRETPIPFGPFLCFAGLISLFYGEWFVQWYLL